MESKKDIKAALRGVLAKLADKLDKKIIADSDMGGEVADIPADSTATTTAVPSTTTANTSLPDGMEPDSYLKPQQYKGGNSLIYTLDAFYKKKKK